MDVIDIKKYDDLKKDYEIYAENVSKKFKSIFNKINAINYKSEETEYLGPII